MQHVLVIGAHGQVGSLLTDKLHAASDFTPVALIRKPEQADDFEKKGVEARVASLEDTVESLARHMKGIDAVVFTAGSGGNTGADKTLTIDLDGAVKAMEAANSTGVNRFVLVSALFTGDRDKWPDEMKPYYVAKHYADRMLEQSGLDYTIVRPGTLKNEAGTGKIDTARPGAEPRDVPREDVASVIVEVLGNRTSIGKVIEFSRGETRIADAVAAL
ncbi:uncharacterized protein YbjT (DUF2867 family) [Neolewinella xylanilytica]|uniref:Uncharacterized protein YbjT (DUF2867 family) n=1 Tax=Neolewinella xylanilytica TaxID=1514080 RepID=A0A2S6I9A6_9BACT|nr:SDR family oxidoreductase [Neolewinella xylanilytica]PPK88084.1 uncharacterized protein YbjT (DUF2867 family) [Neolewinella xylanilytica]